MQFQVAIPFRDRGTDWRRQSNLTRALQHWDAHGIHAHVFDDGLTGPFNRSASYNRAAKELTADIIVYSEADLIVPIEQIEQGVQLAAEALGLVVPFSRFMALTPEASETIRKPVCCGNAFCTFERHSPAESDAVQVRGEYKSIGAVNIVSRETIAAIGRWPEEFSGAWFDDDACERAFSVCCGPTRFVDGPGYHLHHLPGASMRERLEHLSDEDRAATARNKARYELYRQATTPEQIRELTTGGD